MTARTWNAEPHNIHHWKPETSGFGHLFGCPLLQLTVLYICFARARFRFMYSAKSVELIGDFRDAAIFRILRSVTSL